MRLTFFGHACFLLEVAGARLVIDPYLKDNPHGRVAPAKVPCDYVLCTHAHEDHICDAVELAKKHKATIVAPYELAEFFDGEGAKAMDLMPGGGVTLPWGRIDMTTAIHSLALELPGGKNRYMGTASGFVVRAEGKAVYHAGDTALFSDMKLIARGGLDVALLPIGDRYTMGPADAVEALNFLRPKIAVPMHYDTTDKIRQNPHTFAKAALTAGHTVRVMGAGETIEI